MISASTLSSLTGERSGGCLRRAASFISNTGVMFTITAWEMLPSRISGTSSSMVPAWPLRPAPDWACQPMSGRGKVWTWASMMG